MSLLINSTNKIDLYVIDNQLIELSVEFEQAFNCVFFIKFEYILS